MHHGAGAAGFPSRNRTALALVFFMHMLALFVWTRQRPAPLPEAPEVVYMMARPSAARPPSATPSAPAPAPPRLRDKHFIPENGMMPEPARPAAPPAPDPSLEARTPPPSSSAATPGLDDARAPATVQDAIREQKEADGGFSLNLSKRQAGRIDRELRKGKSGIPDEPDTPMGRLRRGLEQAHVERSMSVYEDSYTSPDGVVVYRKRIGKAIYCRRSGSVSPLGMRGMTMGNEAGDVSCPTGVEWKKD